MNSKQIHSFNTHTMEAISLNASFAMKKDEEIRKLKEELRQVKLKYIDALEELIRLKHGVSVGSKQTLTVVR